jgi:hypothetical protein
LWGCSFTTVHNVSSLVFFGLSAMVVLVVIVFPQKLAELMAAMR